MQTIKAIILLFFIALCVNGATVQPVKKFELMAKDAIERGDHGRAAYYFTQAAEHYKHECTGSHKAEYSVKVFDFYKKAADQYIIVAQRAQANGRHERAASHFNDAAKIYDAIADIRFIEMYNNAVKEYLNAALEAHNNGDYGKEASYYYQAALICFGFEDYLQASTFYLQAAKTYKDSGDLDKEYHSNFEATMCFGQLAVRSQSDTLKAMYYKLVADIFYLYGDDSKKETIENYEAAIAKYEAAGMNYMAEELRRKVSELGPTSELASGEVGEFGPTSESASGESHD